MAQATVGAAQGRMTRGITPWKRFAADPAEWFSADEIAEAKAYVRPMRIANGINKGLSLAAVVAVIGLHVAPELLDRWNIDSWVLGVLVTMALLTVVDTLVSIPFQAWRELSYEKRSGMSNQSTGGFIADIFKGLALETVITSVLLVPVWALVRSTDNWWIYGWLVMAGFSLAMLVLFPVVIAPIFNKFKPLDDGELKDGLLSLARRAGADINDVLVADASRRTRRDNAYVAGLGATRQVVMFDNLLERPAKIIESVVGHEIGHWKLGHLKRTLPLAIITLFVNFFALKLLLDSQWLLDFAGVDRLGDAGAVPLFILLFPLIGSVTGTVNTWLIRAHERDADLYALELTGDPDSFIEAMRSLHADNKADLAPSAWQRLRMSHPPAAERMAMGAAWASRA